MFITKVVSLSFALLASSLGSKITKNGFPIDVLQNEALVALEGGSAAPLSLMTNQAYNDVNLKVGKGWYNFTFTNELSFANHNFVFKTHEQTVLKVTDAFCAGDVFQVFDHGQFLFQTSAVGTTCDNYTPLPDVAWPSIGWSSGYFFLDPGFHNITIQVIASPYTAGSANIRVDFEWATRSHCHRRHHHRRHRRRSSSTNLQA